MQGIKAGIEISDRAWRRRLAPDCSHPCINLLRSPNYVQVRPASYATAGQDLGVRVIHLDQGLREGVHSSQGLCADRDTPGTLSHAKGDASAPERKEKSRGEHAVEREGGAMILIFLIGLQLGVLIGAGFCIRYLRRELSADIGPKLKRMQAQLDSLEAALNLAVLSRYAELSERLPPYPLPPPRPPLS